MNVLRHSTGSKIVYLVIFLLFHKGTISASSKHDVLDRLETTIVPLMRADNWSLFEVCEFLNKGSGIWNIEGKATRFEFFVSPEYRQSFSATSIINLNVSQIPAIELIKYAATLTRSRFKIHANGVTFFPFDDTENLEKLYDLEDWTQRAHLIYPDSAKEGTQLRSELQRRIAELKSTNPKFFERQDWPMALAAMVSQKTPSNAAPEPLSKMKFEFYPENTESESDRKIKEIIRESGMIGSSEEIAKEVTPATVTIYSKKKDGSSSQGSGFHIGDGNIVTNYHVIEKSIEILVKFYGSEDLHEVNTIIFIDSDNDIAVLGIERTMGPSISKFNFELPSIGSEVYASGTPKGFESTFSNGIVSAIRDDSGFNRIQITAPVSPGSSGGPVVDSSGACIGIAFASVKNGQNLNFAVPIIYLRDGLRSVKN
jgi:hypothetical protein